MTSSTRSSGEDVANHTDPLQRRRRYETEIKRCIIVTFCSRVEMSDPIVTAKIIPNIHHDVYWRPWCARSESVNARRRKGNGRKGNVLQEIMQSSNIRLQFTTQRGRKRKTDSYPSKSTLMNVIKQEAGTASAALAGGVLVVRRKRLLKN